METLKKKIRENRVSIVADLDLDQHLLSALSQHHVIPLAVCASLQQMDDIKSRNTAFLDFLDTHSGDVEVYKNLIMCLHSSGQVNVATLLIDVGEELRIINQLQVRLDNQLKKVDTFLATEERRAGVFLTETQTGEEHTSPALTEKDVLSNVHESLERSRQQLARCEAVIQKLHQDCEAVAQQNADIVEHTKECDAKIKAVLSFGRHSAKQRSVPKKTHDLFGNLMDDIEKLVNTRRKVLDKETEGRRHSTRIIRQCRNWIESRTLDLNKLNHLRGPDSVRSSDTNNEGVVNVSVQKQASQANENAISSILDSLQQLEQELQQYVHQEIILSEKYRQEMRRKQLQRKVHGLNMQGLAEIESALRSLEKNPDQLKENLEQIKVCISQFNQEYSECINYLNKVDPVSSIKNEDGDTSPTTGRKTKAKLWPNNFKRSNNTGENSKQHLNTNLEVKGKYVHNELLDRLKSVGEKNEELKSEVNNISVKFRIELSKQKREMDLLLQKKDGTIMRLQMDVKEITAEKDKYKKLYNDTKIGYQKNSENLTPTTMK